MVDFKPSYEEYRGIIKAVQNTGKAMNYQEAENKDSFVIVRHDVEFSIDRAYKMSMVESEEGFQSTYFVQITNNTYNAFSKRNIEMLKDMSRRGHCIGLHYHLNGQTDSVSVRDGVRDQLRIMTEMLGMPITCYSFHRPKKEVYYYDISIPNTLNAYSNHFFTYADNVGADTKLEVKYIADSKHRWNYGYPDYETLMSNKKVQLLIHPFSWTDTGFDNHENFSSLIQEKKYELIDTLTDEFQRFREVRDEIIEELK